jgi:hypothetical protein
MSVKDLFTLTDTTDPETEHTASTRGACFMLRPDS